MAPPLAEVCAPTITPYPLTSSSASTQSQSWHTDERAPSEVRDQLCQKLWDEVCDSEGVCRVILTRPFTPSSHSQAECVRNAMHARAQQDAHAYGLRVCKIV